MVRAIVRPWLVGPAVGAAAFAAGVGVATLATPESGAGVAAIPLVLALAAADVLLVRRWSPRTVWSALGAQDRALALFAMGVTASAVVA